MANTDWMNNSLNGKRDELRRLVLETEEPSFFPKKLEDFCDWEDGAIGLKSFSRPILYKQENKDLREEVQKLIRVALMRWTRQANGDSNRVSQLEALTKMLTSRYHQERQHRLDAEREVATLRSSTSSLTAKLREFTGTPSVRLVESDPKGEST